MIPVSVVIITLNEAHIVGQTIAKAQLISNDIVVIDNGSTDDTVQIARRNGCRVYQKAWDGYGANKNKGIELAEYDWILSLDADEIPDDKLIASLHQLVLCDCNQVYDIKFRSYIGKKQVRFGKWGRDHHVRLFNRTQVKWMAAQVHETLLIPKGVKRERIKGNIHHYSVKDVAELQTKSETYAALNAVKYYGEGKEASMLKLYVSPVFNFIKNYLFCLGFLDGKAGWQIARTTFKHTHLKYLLLQKMNNSKVAKKVYIQKKFAIEY
ncbi:(heptosyl)LPS beta-1,4-glucosyltransferase [Mucilaginibacter gracilis]|uniref:(Heptosyl)LPS beta-1,4-glucosyltransferase n=1 Tax=Mucilaginibacter gracilis TaxID=423350 RepID=A0A495J548_9SPHI|nr:glycosyltransferase family 2 protein [Mucilaginibacter gracilis]RKR83528.1 (heptosyl)LPS beta-1,4-glucosyltransferase [Mucilaginibacter gracilis]